MDIMATFLSQYNNYYCYYNIGARRIEFIESILLLYNNKIIIIIVAVYYKLIILPILYAKINVIQV